MDESRDLKAGESIMEGGQTANEEGQSKEQELEELRAQILNLLLELEQAQETSQKQQENNVELQELLDDERLASAHQAEAFSRQIECLQAQLGSVQELQEEVLLLQQTADEYELENVTLRAEIAMKSQRRDEDRRREGDVDQLKVECAGLIVECETLRKNNNNLTVRLQLLQRASSSGMCPPLKEEDEGGDNLTAVSAAPCRLVDACIQKNISFDGKPLTPTSLSAGFSEIVSLREQLKQAEERAELLQRQCDGVRAELRELQDLFETSQKERAELELELLHCREELEKLSERQSCAEPTLLSLPFLGMIFITALVWCLWSELPS